MLEYSSAPGSGRCAVTGGFVVRDPTLTGLVGRYVYADFCAGQLRSFVPTLDGAVDDAPTGIAVDSPASFGEGGGRRIYVASLGRARLPADLGRPAAYWVLRTGMGRMAPP